MKIEVNTCRTPKIVYDTETRKYMCFAEVIENEERKYIAIGE